ncbi:MAG: hypothetical protein ACLPN6_12975 [Streptosporangiaceae bacterium]|nr:hypothetical protein [Actinomycetota bacterium]
MIRSSRGAFQPRRLLVLAVAAVIPILAGCEAGNSAPTLQWHYPTDGAGTIVNNTISVRNVFVLGAPLNQTIPAGQSAGLFFAIVNDGRPDRLLSVSAPGTAKSVSLPGGALTLRTSRAILLTGPQPAAVLQNLSRPLTGGSFVRLVMNFQYAGSVTLDVPVMPQAQYYSTFSPPPSSTPAPGKHHATRAASPGSSPSPTPSTSP